MEDDPKRTLADDPNFMASLTDLDRGLSGQPDSAAARGGRAARPLLELFPPSPPQPSPPPTTPPAFPVPAAPPPAPPRRTGPQPTTCETFYGLNEPPFGVAATDLKFLYQSTGYDRAAQMMLGAIARRDGIVLLTGTMGIGKTTLCRAVIDQLDRRTLISFIDEPFQSVEALLKKVLIDFGVVSAADARAGRLRNAKRTELSTALRGFLSSLAPLQAFAVVIIDEAQNLPREVLKQVSLLVEGEGPDRPLQVVLAGQPAPSPHVGEARPAIAVTAHRGPMHSRAPGGQ